MKKIERLKLNQLSKTELEKKGMNMIKGGACGCSSDCTYCGCDYAGEQCATGDDYYGGSSTGDNQGANIAEGIDQADVRDY